MLAGTCSNCGNGIFPVLRTKEAITVDNHSPCGKGYRADSVHEVEKYKYRSLPCSAGDWSVCGFDSLLNGGGVLEWCFDETDAKERLGIMQAYPQFQNLSIDDGRGSQGTISEDTLRAIHKGQSLENVRR